MTRHLQRLLMLLALGGAAPAASADEPVWRQLFNGRDLDGWVVKLAGHQVGDNYGDTFRVENGVLGARYDSYPDGFGNRFGHLFFDEEFSNYHLAVEYRFVGEDLPSTPGWARRNSGVMLHSQDPRTMPAAQDFPISVEFQFLASLGNGRPRPTGALCTPGTHVWIDGAKSEKHCHTPNGPTFAPDQWVRAEAIVRGDQIRHLINGEEVIRYERPVIGGGVVSNYDPHAFAEGKRLTSGYIALQGEGAGVEFRKVEIRELPAE